MYGISCVGESVVNTTTGMGHIPPELIDAILDQFAGSYESSAIWRTCALVNKSFRPHSQRLFFRSITIDTSLPALSRLHAVMENNPHLGTHVRELFLFIRPTGSPEILETLLGTLQRFTGVTSCTWAERLMPSQWPTVENLRPKLYQFLRLPSLIKANIHSADPTLVHFIASCEQLKSLAVNMPSYYYDDRAISPRTISISTAAHGQLEALLIHQDCILSFVQSFTSLSALRRLSHLRKLTWIGSFRRLEEEIQVSQQVLDLCAESLEELAVGKYCQPPSFCRRTRDRQARYLLTLLQQQACHRTQRGVLTSLVSPA